VCSAGRELATSTGEWHTAPGPAVMQTWTEPLILRGTCGCMAVSGDGLMRSTAATQIGPMRQRWSRHAMTYSATGSTTHTRRPGSGSYSRPHHVDRVDGAGAAQAAACETRLKGCKGPAAASVGQHCSNCVSRPEARGGGSNCSKERPHCVWYNCVTHLLHRLAPAEIVFGTSMTC